MRTERDTWSACWTPDQNSQQWELRDDCANHQQPGVFYRCHRHCWGLSCLQSRCTTFWRQLLLRAITCSRSYGNLLVIREKDGDVVKNVEREISQVTSPFETPYCQAPLTMARFPLPIDTAPNSVWTRRRELIGKQCLWMAVISARGPQDAIPQGHTASQRHTLLPTIVPSVE